MAVISLGLVKGGRGMLPASSTGLRLVQVNTAIKEHMRGVLTFQALKVEHGSHLFGL